MTPSTTSLVGLAISVVLVGIPVIAFIVQLRRTQTQRVVLHDGELSISDGVSGVLKGIPVDDIGAVAYVPAGYAMGATSEGIWTWGGILILDHRGRVVRHAAAIPGTSLPWRQVFREIPAPVHRELETSTRRAFLRAFPRSLRFGQLWGPTRWAITITLAVFIVPIVVTLVAVVVFAAVQTIAQIL